MENELFDVACEIAEKVKFPELSSALRASRIFHIDFRGAFENKNTSVAKIINNDDNFLKPILPFDCCAIDVSLRASRVMEDFEKLIIVDNRGGGDTFIKAKLFVLEHVDNIYTMSSYNVHVEENFGDLLYGISDSFIMKNGKRIIVRDYSSVEPRFKEAKIMCLESTVMSICSFSSIINSEKQFILEETPKAKNLNKKKIARSKYRPNYTILDPMAIREKLGIINEESDKTHKAPHERRRHIRRLRTTSGYKEDRDIIIPATWIGKSEAVVGNKTYKVRLDL